jgi:hypothetical protein
MITSHAIIEEAFASAVYVRELGVELEQEATPHGDHVCLAKAQCAYPGRIH